MATATKARVTHVVRKVFSGSGVNYKRGQCVDPSGWRLAYKLEEQGRIQVLVDSLEPVQSVDGRWWETEALARAADAAVGLVEEEVPEEEKEPETSSPEEGDAGGYPRWLARGRYLLSNGEEFKGSKAIAETLEADLHDK